MTAEVLQKEGRMNTIKKRLFLIILTAVFLGAAGSAAAAPAVGEKVALLASTDLFSEADPSGTMVAELSEPMEAEVTGEEINEMLPVRIGVLEGYVKLSALASGEDAEAAGTYEEGEKKTLREDIVNYAVQFIGCPYVYGGTDLEHGTDCSGFTQGVFAAFGISLPRTAAEQGNCGTRLELTQAQTGDLILYTDGYTVTHVSIYLGDGMTVQAANSRDGIVIAPIYSNACWAVDIIGG